MGTRTKRAREREVKRGQERSREVKRGQERSRERERERSREVKRGQERERGTHARTHTRTHVHTHTLSSFSSHSSHLVALMAHRHNWRAFLLQQRSDVPHTKRFQANTAPTRFGLLVSARIALVTLILALLCCVLFLSLSFLSFFGGLLCCTVFVSTT